MYAVFCILWTSQYQPASFALGVTCIVTISQDQPEVLGSHLMMATVRGEV
jgi:hypothetical protein